MAGACLPGKRFGDEGPEGGASWFLARRSAGFQTCCIADFPIGVRREVAWPAGLDTRDTADLEVCATPRQRVCTKLRCALRRTRSKQARPRKTTGHRGRER